MAPKSRLLPGLAVGLVLLVAVVLVVMHLGDGREFLAIARRAAPAWLLLALVFQLLTYATEAAVWLSVLRRAGLHRRFIELYQLSIVSLFTNQAIPTAGLAGPIVVVRTLEAWKIPHATAMSAVLLDLVGYYAAYGLSVLVALAFLGGQNEISWGILGAASTLGVLGFVIAGGAMWIAQPGRRLPGFLGRIGPLSRLVTSLSTADPALVRDPRLVATAVLLRTLNFALDAFTLWACLRAVGEPATPGPAVTAFVLGSLARTLGIVPGGIGTSEAATVAGLALFGTHVEPALTATLLFRGLSFWLPMLPGFWLGPRLAARALRGER